MRCLYIKVVPNSFEAVVTKLTKRFASRNEWGVVPKVGWLVTFLVDKMVVHINISVHRDTARGALNTFGFECSLKVTPLKGHNSVPFDSGNAIESVSNMSGDRGRTERCRLADGTKLKRTFLNRSSHLGGASAMLTAIRRKEWMRPR